VQTADNDCLLGTIVDDLLFSEKTGHAIADATCEALRKKYIGVTSEHNPKAFAGYKLEQSPERDVITISMPELIGQKFAQECPELITAKARDAFKLKHVKGGKLKSLADSLQMLPLNPSGKVTHITKEVQTLTGNLQYFKKVSAGELNVVTDYADAGWVTGNGPAMGMFDHFDDFVAYYRIYGTSFEMWYAWNAAQSFCLEEFEEVAPDENNDDVA
jgi:hypothetical protein